MWIFLTSGLILPSLAPASADPVLTLKGRRTIQVRARVRTHLEAFHRRFPPSAASAIELTPAMDYQCRFYTTKESLLAALWPEVDDIDYAKFKPAAGQRGGYAYERLLNTLWTAIYNEYGGWGEPPARRLKPPDERGVALLAEVVQQWETADGSHYLVPTDLIQRISAFLQGDQD